MNRLKKQVQVINGLRGFVTRGGKSFMPTNWKQQAGVYCGMSAKKQDRLNELKRKQAAIFKDSQNPIERQGA